MLFGIFDFVCPEAPLLLNNPFDAVRLHWSFVDLTVQQRGLPGVSGLVAIRCPCFYIVQQIVNFEKVVPLSIFVLRLRKILRFPFAELLGS